MKYILTSILLVTTVFTVFSKTEELDYDTVFNNTKLNVINIDIDPGNWEKMNQDLKDNLGVSANKMFQGQPMEMGDRPMDGNKQPPTDGNRQPPMNGERPMGGNRQPPMNGERPMGNGPIGNMGGDKDNIVLVDFDPVWVESTITFNGENWEHVGIRFKGNSSLKTTYETGGTKFSFKLDFDKFEDDYDDIKNQRFYGFDQLNLNNNFNDPSLMREKVASELFKEFGLIAANTSFYLVNINYGDGYKPYGVYTLVEEVDDTVIKTNLGDDDGNLYKPEGDSAKFSTVFKTDEMYKKNNEKLGDFSDVETLSATLNSKLRLTNQSEWIKQLEEIFDVDTFLKWLAANSVMQNWDTYGKMSHNFYLYNNNGLLTWIPWDNNESLQNGKRGTTTLSLDEIGSDWPLIRYILDIDLYKNQYDSYIKSFTTEIFSTEKMTELYTSYSSILKGYTTTTAVNELKTHVKNRNTVVSNYLK